MARTKEFNQEDVIDKAISLFWEKGYNACSMQDMVDGLGISRSSIYDTFTDKRSLFLLALSTYNQKYTNKVISSIEQSINIKETIKDLFNNIIQELENNTCNKNGCFMVNATIEMAQNDPDIAQIVNNNQKEIELALEKALKKGQEEGIISNEKKPQKLSKFLYNNITGLRVQLKNNPSKEDFQSIIDIILSSL